jgi:hypothetical protein
MAQQTFFSNFARTTLTTSAAASSTQLDVDSSAAFPSIPPLSPGAGFMLVLTDAGETVFEICRCTGVFSKPDPIMTVTRAQEGTAARAWPAGTKVENRLTAATLNALCVAAGV